MEILRHLSRLVVNCGHSFLRKNSDAGMAALASQPKIRRTGPHRFDSWKRKQRSLNKQYVRTSISYCIALLVWREKVSMRPRKRFSSQCPQNSQPLRFWTSQPESTHRRATTLTRKNDGRKPCSLIREMKPTNSA